MNEQLTITRGPAGSVNNARRNAIYGAVFGLAFPLFAIGLSLAQNNLPVSIAAILALHINQPMLWIIDTAPFVLGAVAALAGSRQDSVERLNAQLRDQARDLFASQRAQEQRANQRAQDLDELNSELRRALQVTRKISRIRDSAELSLTAVQSIAENYSDFVVDLYLIDERRTQAVLTASSEGAAAPEDGAGRAFRVGESSLIGQVAASGDAGRSLTGAHGPELALPLLSRGLPLGVLHMHAVHDGVALPANTELLQLITDQLSSAIETSRAFRDSSLALEQLRSLSGQAIHAAWSQGLPNEAVAYEYTPTGTRPARNPLADHDPTSLRIPLELRGQGIGTIVLKRKGTSAWTEADRDLAGKTATQVALALENVRLLEETRERAQTERVLSEFSSRLNQSVNLDTLLQTAVRELAALPEVAGASIYMRPESGPGESAVQRSRTSE